MIQLDLTDNDQKIITDVLENTLSELRMEIANTDRKEYRDMLKERKAVISRVLEAVRPAGSADV